MEPLFFDKKDKALIIKCKGDWTLNRIKELEKAINTLKITKTNKVLIDFSTTDKFDTAGVILLLELKEKLNSQEVELKLNPKQQKILSLIDLKRDLKIRRRDFGFFYNLGEAVVEKVKLFKEFFDFVGRFFISFLRLLSHPSNFRLKETIYHIEKSGFNSLFIIALTSILVGLVVAYQSIVQLAQFGADIFVVDAIGISITRELGPMISAIVIAGRSASSYTAEIGTMKLTEEINAMKTMGFDPYFFLVFPRVIALVISLPLVIFFADITGIFGGMVATKAQGDISFHFFINRLQEVLELKHYLLGLIKGPFFAILIALTGCFHGFRVTSDTESIGIETTASVVHAIFLVIACDAIFSIIYTELGL